MKAKKRRETPRGAKRPRQNALGARP